jgi:hypothetical protein
MPGHLEELKGLAREFVGTHEAIRSAADVNYGGKVNLNLVTTSGAAVLGHQEAQTAAGEALARRLGDEPIVTFPSAAQMALVLTDTRLVIWSRGGWKGKPKAFLGEIPLSALDHVTCEPRRQGDRLTVTMRSGWEITLDVTDEDTGEHTFGPALVAAIPRREAMPGGSGESEDSVGAASPAQSTNAGLSAGGVAPVGALVTGIDPGSDVSGPDVSGSDVSGPGVSGSDVSGPDVSGSDVSGPDISGPGDRERGATAQD